MCYALNKSALIALCNGYTHCTTFCTKLTSLAAHYPFLLLSIAKDLASYFQLPERHMPKLALNQMTLKSSSNKKHSCTSKNRTSASDVHFSFPLATKAGCDPTFTADSEIQDKLPALRPRSPGMHIPGHVVILFIALLIFESSVLFVYTIIGLVKSNPTPYFAPTYMPTYSSPPAMQCIQYELSAAPQATVTLARAISYPPGRFGTRQSQGLDDAGVSKVQTIEATSEAPSEALTSTVMPRSATTLVQRPSLVTSVVLLTTVLEGTTSTMPRSTMFVTTVVPLPTGPE